METPKGNNWPQEAITLLGKEFCHDMDEGAAIYEAHSLDEIQNNPALAIDLARKSRPFAEQASERATKAMVNYIFKHGRAKREPVAAIQKYMEMVAAVFPEADGGLSSTNIFINGVRISVTGQVLARLAKWRHANNKDGRFEKKFYEVCGIKKEDIEKLKKKQPEVYQELMINGFYGYFELLRLEDLFRQAGIEPQADEKGLAPERRKEINAKIAEIISRHQHYGVPLAMHEARQMGTQNVYLQFQDIPLSSPEHAFFTAHVIMYNNNDGQRIMKTPKILEITKCLDVPGNYMSAFPLVNDSSLIFVEKDTGEIHSGQADHKALKFFLGEERYELLRTHVLIHLAELTCKPEILSQQLAEVIEYPNQTDKGEHGKSGGKPGSKPRPQKVLPVRYFPRSLSDRVINTNPPVQRQIRLHNVTYHTRLLPVGNRPSFPAMALARANDFELKIFVQTRHGEIVPYDKIIEISEQMGLGASDYIAIGNGALRYETFVRQHQRGQPDPVVTPQNQVLAIQSVSKGKLLAATAENTDKDAKN